VADAHVDVYLVSMPYAAVYRPSLALGVLKASLEGTGIRCAVEYANLDFGERIGLDVLGLMSFLRTDSLIGEWTFAGAAFPGHPSTAADILGQAPLYQPPNLPRTAVDDRAFAGVFERLRDAAPGFVDEVARRILERGPRIVGCTSTFEQHCASLALLRRIKDLDPSVVTMLGGANCEAEMGWAAIRAFPWVDFVVSGEAELLFPTLCRLALERGAEVPLEDLPEGVLGAAHVAAGAYGPGRRPVPRAVVERMDASPVPDFSDYFAALALSPLRDAIAPALVVETSRGCWWGQKSQCTFCGLNGEGMAYRAKSPERVLAELDLLTRRHGVTRFDVADNILDMRHFKTVLPELARRGAPYQFFQETKANLRRDQVALMAEAGITEMQPGLESLHDSVLGLMAKGNTAIINLQTLKYAREVGIFVMWMLLVGVPGEDDRWHAEVAGWLPLIHHLQPPNSVVHIRFDRFGVYHQRQEAYGLRLRPYPSYAAVYPAEPALLHDLAYFFIDENAPRPPSVTAGAEALGRAVGAWKARHLGGARPVLCMTDRGEEIDFLDTRPCAPDRRTTISGLEAAVYRVADPGLGRAELALRVGRNAMEVAEALERLHARKLMLEIGGKHLALAVPGEVPALPEPDNFPGGWVEKFDARHSASLAEAWRKLRDQPQTAEARA